MENSIKMDTNEKMERIAANKDAVAFAERLYNAGGMSHKEITDIVYKTYFEK